ASLALALSDSEAGLNVALIDQQSLVAHPLSMDMPWQPRVSALSTASINWFNHLGVWELMVSQRACPYQKITVWEGEGTGEIHFDADSVSLPDLGYIVENAVIRHALLMKLADSGIHCFGDQPEVGYQLSGEGGGQVLLADGVVLKAPVLVAAEGAESRLRQMAGIPTNQKDYLHHALVTTVETELAHEGCARQVFLDTGPLAFLPLPERGGRHYCSIVWSLLPAQADRLETLADAAFCDELGQAFEGRAGTIIHADPRLRFPLRERHARQYHRQGVVLVGDAAHTIHPLAGQGVNLGFMDVAVLSEELIRACRRGDDFYGPHILDRYQRRRKPSNTAMMAAMAGFQNVFGADDIRIRWLRNAGLTIANRMPLIKSLFIHQAMGTQGDLPESVRPR
ncbi:MAG: FAD-dependent monooxygenase, partial [Endozoicomonas sp.]